MTFANKVYIDRQETLAQTIQEGIVIIRGNSVHEMTHGSPYPFHQNIHILYLTGITNPDVTFVMMVQSRKCTTHVFSPEPSLSHKIWFGDTETSQDIACTHEIDEGHINTTFDTWIVETLIETHLDIFLILPELEKHEGELARWLSCIHAANERDTFHCPTVRNVSDILAQMRRVKTPLEIKKIREACAMSSVGHLEVMHNCRAFMYEYHVEALFSQVVRGAGGSRLQAYSPIVATGNNACALHYQKNDAILSSGELLLIDAGTEVSNYASDITRTIPVNGVFTEIQRAIYTLVLHAQLEAIDHVRVGNDFQAPHRAAMSYIVRGLLDLEIIEGEFDEIIQILLNKENRDVEDPHIIWKILPHATSHWLGLGVHDDISYHQDSGDYVLFESGMVLTIEPGLYLHQWLHQIPHKYRGMGIRIEDVVVVTDNDPVVLSSMAPKNPDEIEIEMNIRL